jgi:exonuclease III
MVEEGVTRLGCTCTAQEESTHTNSGRSKRYVRRSPRARRARALATRLRRMSKKHAAKRMGSVDTLRDGQGTVAVTVSRPYGIGKVDRQVSVSTPCKTKKKKKGKRSWMVAKRARKLVRKQRSVDVWERKVKGKGGVRRAPRCITVGTWNVRTSNPRGRNAGLLEVLAKTIAQANVDVCGLQETRRVSNSEAIRVAGYHAYFSGEMASKKGVHGVGILVREDLAVSGNLSVKPVSARVLHAQLRQAGSTRGAKETMNFIVAYAPHEGKTDREKSAFYANVERYMASLHTNERCILLIDGNAQVGARREEDSVKVVGRYRSRMKLERRPPNGQHLVDLCTNNKLAIMSTHFQKPLSKQYTFLDPRDKANSQKSHSFSRRCLDYICVKQRDARTAMNVNVIATDSTLSDHRLVTATFLQRQPFRKPAATRRCATPVVADRSKFHDKDARKKLVTEIAAELHTVNTQTESAAKRLMCITQHARQLTEQQVPRARKRQDLDPWMDNPAVQQAMETFRATLADPTVKVAAKKKARHEWQRVVTVARNLYWEKVAEMIATFNANNDFAGVKHVTRSASDNRTVKRVARPIQDDSGVLQTENLEIAKGFCEHFKRVLSMGDRKLNTGVLLGTTERPVSLPLDDVPSESEVMKALSSLRNGKATGDDGISVELLKMCADTSDFRVLLTEAVAETFETGTVPQDWIDKTIIPLFKKGALDCRDNYRGIALSSIIGKLLLKVVQRRLAAYVEKEGLLPEEQSGFRAHRSVLDSQHTARRLLETAKSCNVRLYMAFVDISKAYDTVDRDLLWCVLHRIGVPRKMVGVIKAFHDNMTASVRVGGEKSDVFSVDGGLGQGCVLAPLLFNIYFNALLEVLALRIADDAGITAMLVDATPGTTSLVRRAHWCKPLARETVLRKLYRVLYADDAKLVTLSEDSLQRMLHLFDAVSTEFGLTMSFKKTNVMQSYVRGESAEKPPPSLDIRNAKGEKYVEVDHFKYLGSILECNGSAEKDIKSRVGAAWGSFWKMNRSVFDRRRISLAVKMKLYQQCVLPALMFGSATWILTDTALAPIQTAHHHMLLRMLRFRKQHRTDHLMAYDVACEKMKCMPIKLTIRKAQLSWLGNLMRMEDDRVPRMLAFGALVFPNKGPTMATRWKSSVCKSLEVFGIQLRTEDWGEPTSKADWKKRLDAFALIARDKWLGQAKLDRANRHLAAASAV